MRCLTFIAPSVPGPQIKKERLTKYQGCNLYIKNLDESLNDEWLRTNFGKFGTITSAR